MPPQTAETIFEPLIRVANRGTAVPPMTTKFKAPWAGWEAFEYIPEDVGVNWENPKEGIDTKDYGEIGARPTGGESIGVQVATVRPRAIDLRRAFSLVESIVEAAAERSSLGMSAGNTATTVVRVTVRLDTGTGVLTDFPVDIPAGQTAEQAAATIRSGVYAGYTTGGTGATVIFTATNATPRVDAQFVGGGSVAGAMSTVKQFRPAFSHHAFDPQAESNFMMCLEGFANKGGLYANDRVTRVFFWNVEQVSEGGGRGGGRRRGGGGGGGGGRRRGGGGAGSPGEAKFGWSNDGIFTAAYTLKAQPEPNRDTMIAGTGYEDVAVPDRYKRMDMYHIDATTLVA